MNPSRRKVRAIHEAAHAVGCEFNGWPVKRVLLREERTVVAGVPSSTNGFTEALHPKPSIEFLGLLVGVALSGYGALRRIDLDRAEMEHHAKNTGLDWQTIEGYFEELHVEPGYKLAAIYDGVAVAEDILNNNPKAIERISEVLVQTSEINGDDVRRIIKEEQSN